MFVAFGKQWWREIESELVVAAGFAFELGEQLVHISPVRVETRHFILVLLGHQFRQIARDHRYEARLRLAHDAVFLRA